jgi:hypothetical protein
MWATPHLPNVGPGVLQTLLELQTSSSGQRHAVLHCHMTWCYYVTLILFVTTQEKLLATATLSPQKTSQFGTNLESII